MKKCYLLVCAVALTASIAAAGDTGLGQAFIGYNWVRFNPDTTNLAGTAGLPSFSLNGGDVQLAYTLKPGIGLVLDVGAVHAGSLFSTVNGVTGSGVDHTLTNFVLGPRYTYHRHKRWMPFAQALFGAAHATSSTSVALLDGGVVWPPPGVIVAPGTPQPVDATLQAERTGFAMLIGGGLDIKISKHIAFRPIGADYYFTRLPAFLTGDDTNKHHFRYSAGVNFLFGAR